MSDKDFMIYLRNVTLALCKQAKEKGVKLSLNCNDEYAAVRAGDYVFYRVKLDDIGLIEVYEYDQIGVKDNEVIFPEQVQFHQAPMRLQQD